MESKAVITAWDPPRRFVGENKDGMGSGSPAMATEWTVEAKSGGTCRVRVVHSWFASTDDWDNQYESVEKGWPAFFRVLKIYNEPKPAGPPEGYRLWPLWYVSIAFYHNKLAGGLFVLGLAANAILGL